MSTAALRRLAAVAALALLQACATRPPAPSPEAQAAWHRHQGTLTGVSRFSLQGRFAVGGIFGTKGQVRWDQSGGGYGVRLWGPFGAGAIQISGDLDHAEIRTADEHFQTSNPEAALRDRFGWTLPVAQLRWWVLGLPAPGDEATLQLDAEGRLAGLNQAGWTVEFQEYQAVVERSLPRRLALANEEVSVKLVVDQWSGIE